MPGQEAYDQLQAGSIKGIAVGSKERNRRLPDLPTLNETALPGYEAVVWYSLMAPAKLPADITSRLNRAITNIAADPKFSTPIIERGYDVIPSTPEAMAERVRVESRQWAGIISELDKK
ncbi:tripartite tricarboxylate transporter substrate-binding protein [Ferrovibrio sp.]|uniref:tripartite tricarboxylate transporter substrate-binding protein n=1 Tax=Ferrovibrio sp. TaxID=1917215 RepID=UPI0026174FF0|nr:tripartite tricarboxylate transporter substrate-binding protein [Ferrovibrio sp.]